LLGVYVSNHPFKPVANDVARFVTHQIAEVGMELKGQTVTIGGLVNRVQSRVTRDGRKFYVVDLEDLSGTVELTVWNDTIELTGEEIWAEGRVLVCSIEVRDRGDRVGLNVRKAAPYDAAEGSVVGFVAEQWQVEGPRRRPRTDQQPPAAGGTGAPATANGQRPTANAQWSPTANRQQPAASSASATTEAARPGIVPPVSADSARLTITIHETEDILADEALLRAVVGMLKAAPGTDEVRLVIRDTEGQDTEFDLPRAEISEELARSARNLLRNQGQVKLSTPRMAGAA
jgi:hypothetical protein